MRRIGNVLALVTMLASASVAFACGTSTPEYKSGRDQFYKCFGDHVESETKTTTAQELAQNATHQWCEKDLRSWYATIHEGCDEPVRTDVEKEQAYGVFQSTTTKGLVDMINAIRAKAKP